MKKIYAVTVATTLALGLSMGQATAATTTTNISVLEDGYYLGNFANWYNTSPFAKAYSATGDMNGSGVPSDLSTQGYFKYDINALSTAGITAADVSSATMNFYLRAKGGMGPTPLPIGQSDSWSINPYESAPDFTDYAGTRGSVSGSYTVNRIISPTVDVTTGATELITLDVTDIVKGWLAGTYNNYGLEMVDLTYDTGYSLYWATMEDTGATYGNVTPYLQVSTSPVPVPGAIWLLGSGMAGLFGLKRRRTTV